MDHQPRREFGRGLDLATFQASQKTYATDAHLSATETFGQSDIRPTRPKPMGQLINCLPGMTPRNGSAAQIPKRDPVATNAILAGAGVPTWLAAKAAKVTTATLML